MASRSSSSSPESEKAPLLSRETTNVFSNDSSPSHSESEDARVVEGLRKRRGKRAGKARPRRTLSSEVRRRMDEDAAMEAFKSDPRFNPPSPSILSRVLLLAFLGFMIWLAVNMRMTLLDDKRHGKSRAASAFRRLHSVVSDET